MDAIRHVVNALRFHERNPRDLENIRAEDWPDLLVKLDEAHLTLAVGVRCREFLPERVRFRIDRNRAANGERYERLMQAQAEISQLLSARRIDFVVLKGLTQWPYFCHDPWDRPQYDIDIYIPPDGMSAAAKAVCAIGYEPVSDKLDIGADHLPVMIRKTGWQWRGDYFDPEMPPSLELHFRFWNRHGMRFDIGDTGHFWRNRAGAELDPAGRLTYSALHLVRHLLTGDLRLRHVYEIAHFLEHSVSDESFWTHWNNTGLKSCRVVEGIAFRLASEWFHCALHPLARGTIEELPGAIKRWFQLFGCSPALITSGPNKNELWLHLCLVKDAKARREIVRRRLLPTRHSRVIPDAAALASRSLHHLRALAPTARGAYLWWRGLPSDRTQPSETARS